MIDEVLAVFSSLMGSFAHAAGAGWEAEPWKVTALSWGGDGDAASYHPSKGKVRRRAESQEMDSN